MEIQEGSWREKDSFGNISNVLNACETKEPSIYANGDLTPDKPTVLRVLRHTEKKFPTKSDGYSLNSGKIHGYMK